MKAQLAYIRKALLAAGGSFVAGEIGAVVKAQGWPGWAATGAVALAALGVGYTVYRAANGSAPVKPAPPAAG